MERPSDSRSQADLMEILDVKTQFAGVELSAIASLKRRLEEATKRHKGAERSTGGSADRIASSGL